LAHNTSSNENPSYVITILRRSNTMRKRPKSRYENEDGALNIALVGEVPEYPEVRQWDNAYRAQCDQLSEIEAIKTGARRWGRWWLDRAGPGSLNTRASRPGIGGRPSWRGDTYDIGLSRLGPNGESDGGNYTWIEHMAQKNWIGPKGIADLRRAIADMARSGLIGDLWPIASGPLNAPAAGPMIGRTMMNGPTKIIPDTEPCHVLNYCPYGALVEDFPYHPEEHRCDITGHECPAFTVSEDVVAARAYLAEGNQGITENTTWKKLPDGRVLRYEAEGG
jgi:hypothetical protein